MAAWSIRLFSYVVFLLLLLPLTVLIGASFAEQSYVTFPPRELSLRWYEAFFADDQFLPAFILSAELALATALIATPLGFLAAYTMVRKRFPGRQLCWSLFISPLIVPQIVLGVALLQFFTALGLARSFLGLLIAHVVSVMPFVIRTVAGPLLTMDKQVEEAAADLGANPVQTLWLVVAPMVKGGLIAGGLFAFIMSWANVEVSIFLSVTGTYTLPVVMYNFLEYSITTIVIAAAAIAIYVAMLLVIVIDRIMGMDAATKL